MAADDGLEYLSSEDLINIPEDSVVDTESSDGQDRIYPSEEESGGDHENDEDYIMDEDNLDPDEDIYVTDCEPKEGKGKGIKVSTLVIISWSLVTDTCKNRQKSQKGDFRRDINNARTNSAIAGNTASNFAAKMKPPTVQKRKESLGEKKSL